MINRFKASKKFFRGLFVGLAGIILSLALWSLGWLEAWETKSWDWRASLLAKPGKTTDEIRLIKLDQASLDWGVTVSKWPWPWPREVFSAIINFCHRSGAKALAFDVIFTEFSWVSMEDDELLGTAISEFGNFAGAVNLRDTQSSKVNQPDNPSLAGIKIDGLDQWLTLTKARGIVFPGMDLPISQVAQNAAIFCNVKQNPARDGIYRQVKAFGVFDTKVFPSLGLGTYLAANRDVQLRIEPGRLIVGDKFIPIDNQGNAVLRYRGRSGTHKAYSAQEVLQAQFRLINDEEPTSRDKAIAKDLKDKYVLFGYTAPGLLDLRPAPVDGKYSGVEINITVLDNFLAGDFIRKSPLWLTISLVIILTLTCATLLSLFTKPVEDVVTSIIFLALPVLLSLGMYVKGLWLPLAIQEIAIVITVIFSLVLDYATEGRQKRFIKDAFKYYLSPAVIEQLIQYPEQLKLGGERRTLSIFFSDLQGFTSISERLDPEGLTALLNDYLSVMTDIIQEEGGTVDKYEGDAIIAFWNAPLNVPDHAVRVVRAALRCQTKLAEMRPVFKARVGRDLFMRIGMNTGPVVVGNMGSHNRFNYTILGDAVNLASRLEGVNKQFGTYTMISQTTFDLIDETFAARELARVAVVGRKEPVTVYEPMLREEYAQKKKLLETFAQGLTLFYEGKLTQASEVFATIRDVDPPATAYAEKIREYVAAPPEDWQGVWVMTSK
jgi:adenylate cyclase